MRDLHVEVLGVSVDAAPSQKAFIEANDFGFDMLSDFNKELSARFGVLLDNVLGYKGIANRAVFLIDREGTIRYAAVSESPKELPDAEAALAAAKEL